MPFALNGNQVKNPYQMQIGDRQTEDITWLLG